MAAVRLQTVGRNGITIIAETLAGVSDFLSLVLG
jgi:hypothetical protein